MVKELPVGVAGSGVLAPDNSLPDIDTQFRLVREAGAFDYFDRMPPPAEVDAYRAASEKYALPIRATGFYYRLIRDEPLLEWHLRIAALLGARDHNVQVLTADATGVPVTDRQVADFYLRAAEWGERSGVAPCFEVHVNMWSEHLGRIERVGRMVEAAGGRFAMTLDHSHVIFKIDNPREQAVQDMRADIEAGRLQIDPRRPDYVVDRWIGANWVRHAHARAAVPNNPVNVWAKHPDGSFGRGIQVPFVRPTPGEWHSDWDEAVLEPWKETLRRLLRHHAQDPASPLGQVSCEFIPPPDYGGGAKYSIFAQNIACARWIRAEWAAISRPSA